MGRTYSIAGSNPFRNRGFYANDFDALIPEFWAQESLAVLEENLVVGQMVNRDFNDEVKDFGDTVNTRRPSSFTAKRKWHEDDVTVQDASTTNVQVKLNQHVHVSFLIKDGQQTLSMKDLVKLFIQPAMRAEAEFVDSVLMGQYAEFLYQGSVSGALGDFTSSNAKERVVDAREKLNTQLAYVTGRNMILGAKTESTMLKPEWFTSADKVGDNGTALRTASLGHKLGFDFFMSQTAPSIVGTFTTSDGAINLTAGYPAGTTSALVVDGITGIWTTGSWVKIGGQPYQITAHSETTGNTTGITLNRALAAAVANNDVITRYTPGAVNLLAGYAVDHYGTIAFDGFTGATPKKGQVISFGVDTTKRYTVVEATSTTILLDRPLETAVADDAALNIAPSGDYNFGFHKDAITMVIRPLALPATGAGARAAVVNYNGLSIRVCITYNGTKQGHLVTLDFMFGVKVLDYNLGVVLLG